MSLWGITSKASTKKKIQFKHIIIFLIVFLSSSVLAIFSAINNYSRELDSLTLSVQSAEFFKVQQGKISIINNLKKNSTDLLFLYDLLDIKNISEKIDWTNDYKNLALLEQEYLSYGKRKSIYDQIRLLDSVGNEILRINYNNGKPFIVAKENLQYKGNSSYFSETIKINKEQIYVSPLDLSVEDGEVEHPIKPIIRLATPIVDKNGNKQGVIVLNYLAEFLLKDFREVTCDEFGQAELINSSGYFLSSDNPNNEWGFMYERNNYLNFKYVYPDLWQKISGTNQGQYALDEGILTFDTISLFDFNKQDGKSVIIQDNELNNYNWKIVSFVDNNDLHHKVKEIGSELIYHSTSVILLLVFISLVITYSISHWLSYRAQLQYLALHDNLTGLPNRVFLQEEIDKAINKHKRLQKKFAILFIDLDMFKNINDSYGHEVGDSVLLETSKRIKASIRKNDIASRLGGDEFVILLPLIETIGDVKEIAERLITNVSASMCVNNCNCCVGVSMGISLFPHHASTADELINCADEAMYKAKNNGRGRYCFDGDLIF